MTRPDLFDAMISVIGVGFLVGSLISHYSDRKEQREEIISEFLNQRAKYEQFDKKPEGSSERANDSTKFVEIQSGLSFLEGKGFFNGVNDSLYNKAFNEIPLSYNLHSSWRW